MTTKNHASILFKESSLGNKHIERFRAFTQNTIGQSELFKNVSKIVPKLSNFFLPRPSSILFL